ncbi:arabinogalactan oligomer / maltooligosaccharide transport system permease protein [Caloramator fervidus]|uniref:Arabinogalactan oligomer / maltooligosaccharide transport system permease protein n=1 Tax=Caloramator fervidus TaxID=29344 RepID=A0A1H5VHY7_9CLOT|nr:sugar ABC transporter permease [Caloramator fervidus]SEF86985.1 arabinogalactan oligomer / maltooligosaccharide transport system permease protein [Caloramator fervidus]
MKFKQTNRGIYQKWWTPYAFIFPAFLVVLFIIFIPLIFEFMIALFDIRLQNIRLLRDVGINIFSFPKIMKNQFLGFGNYAEILKDKLFYRTFLRTVIWTFTNVFFHVVIGVWLAILLNRKLPGKSVFRVLLILPWAMPQYIAAITWKGMFNYEFGAVNLILNKLGIEKINWLGDPTYTLMAAIITNIWLGVPFMMMVALGGLQSIPSDLYESADIDGASSWQKFKNITIPMLKPVMVPAIILGTVWTFNMLNIIYIMKDGLPGDDVNILITKMYRDGFDLYRYGYAAALSVIIFIILTLFSIAYLKANQNEE